MPGVDRIELPDAPPYSRFGHATAQTIRRRRAQWHLEAREKRREEKRRAEKSNGATIRALLAPACKMAAGGQS
jgi:hypothetical protein